MLGLSVKKIRTATQVVDELKALKLNDKLRQTVMLALFFNVLQITSSEFRPDLTMGEAIEMWEYGLDQFYIEEPVFRLAYDRYSREEPYAGLTFQQFLRRTGVTLKTIRAAQKRASNYKAVLETLHD